LKSDNGGPFQADSTKRLLAAAAVTALFNPRRRPSYNGGIERANGQLAGYQEALAEFHGRPGMPTCDDARGAQRLANESTRPEGWRGPTAGELWNWRAPLAACQRADFLAAVTERRTVVRGQRGFAAAESLNHYAQAAVDRRAVRDALVAHDLLRLHPRRRKRGAKTAGELPNSHETALASPQAARGAGTIQLARVAPPPIVGGAQAQATCDDLQGQHQPRRLIPPPINRQLAANFSDGAQADANRLPRPADRVEP
jgi:hypothetical protein